MNALGVARALGFGAGLGVATSMSPAVVNVSIVDAAAAGRRRFATGLGLGGAVADTVHAALAFAGVGRLVLAEPALVRTLAIVAAVAIVAYAALSWRRRRDARAPAGEPTLPARCDEPRAPLGRGIATGFALTLVNPAALGAWVAVSAAVWPDAPPLEAAVIAGGVGAGSAAWFVLLAHWIGRLRRDHPVLAWVPRASLVLLVAIAVVGVVRVL